MQQKYIKDTNFLIETYRPGSYVWTSICKAKEVLKGGFKLRLGDGSSSFWYDDWMSLGPLCQQVDFVAIHDTALQINDLFRNNCWHLNSLVTILPPTVREAIIDSRIFLNSQVPDTCIWDGNLDGTYTAKAGFQWLSQQGVVLFQMALGLGYGDNIHLKKLSFSSG